MAIERKNNGTCKLSRLAWRHYDTSRYIKASERHPHVGRLYHYLAILAKCEIRCRGWIMNTGGKRVRGYAVDLGGESGCC